MKNKIWLLGALFASLLWGCKYELPQMKKPNLVVMSFINNPNDFVVFVNETYPIYNTDKLEFKIIEPGKIKLINEQGEEISGEVIDIKQGHYLVKNKRPIKVGEKVKLIVENTKYGVTESPFLPLPEPPIIKSIEVDKNKSILRVVIDNQKVNNYYSSQFEFYKNEQLLPISFWGGLREANTEDFIFDDIFLSNLSYTGIRQPNGSFIVNNADRYDIRVARSSKEIYDFFNQFDILDSGLKRGISEYTAVQGLNMSKGDGFFGVSNSVKIKL
jgi:hypothetical protein